jgi:hypothetical protein
MLSPNFYTKSIIWQIILDFVIIVILAVTVISSFNKGFLEKSLIPSFSLTVSIGLAVRTIYLIIISIKSLILKRWGLFIGCLIHTIIIGGIFYASLFSLLLSIGALGGGTTGY